MGGFSNLRVYAATFTVMKKLHSALFEPYLKQLKTLSQIFLETECFCMYEKSWHCSFALKI